MGISFQSIGRQSVSFFGSAKLKAGQPCKVASNNTVGACAAGDRFCGVVGNGRDGVYEVTLKGFVTLPYTGTAPTVGYSALAADGNGGVAVTEDANEYLVTVVNTVDSTVGFFL